MENTRTLLGRAMLRCPSRPVDAYPACPADTDPVADVRRMWADPVLRESVRIASSVLHDRIEHLLAGGPDGTRAKKAASVHRALVRYAIRISTRPTPFGTFGGFAMIDPAAGGDLRIAGPARYRRHVRPGFGYVRHLTAAADPDRDLLVAANPSAHTAGDRVALLVSPRGPEKMVNQASSVRSTPPVRIVLDRARRPVRTSELHRVLAEAFPDVDADVLRRFLGELRNSGVLVTELDTSLFDADPLRGLRSDPRVGETVAAVTAAIDRYARGAPGDGGTGLGRLYRFLRDDPNTTQEQLQVDLQMDARGGLPAAVRRGAGRALDAMLHTTLVPARHPELRAHAGRFGDHFGQTLVPLPEVLDPERGIGFPAGYRSSAHPAVTDPSAGLPPGVRAAGVRLRATLIETARRTGATTVELTPRMLADVPAAPGLRASSYDVFVQLDTGPGGEVVAAVGPTGVSLPAGRVHGRFAHHDPACAEQMHRLGRVERAASEDVLFCEIDYVSNYAAVNNVACTPGTQPYRLRLTTGDFGTDDAVSVAPADVLVGVGPDGFHLVHGPTGRPMLFRSSNLVTPEVSADVVRFLEEIGIDGFVRPGWQWGEFDGLADFLPGVEYAGVRLASPQWRLPVLRGDADEQDRALLEWIAAAGVPAHVYAGVLDNRLLLHLRDRVHRDLLRREYASGLDRVGAAPRPDELGWARDDDGRRHATEVVVSLTGDPAVALPRPPHAPRMLAGIERQRTLPPGRGWWYARLHGPAGRQNELLAYLAGRLPDRSWFHVRYRDPDDHVRLRVRSGAGIGADALSEVLNELVDAHVVTRWSFDTYRREIERYGGPEGMRAAEVLFCAESAFLARNTDVCGDASAMWTVPGEDPDTDAAVEAGLPDAAEFLRAGLGSVCADAEADTVLRLACAGYRDEFADDGPALRRSAGPMVGAEVSARGVRSALEVSAELAVPGAALADSLSGLDGEHRARVLQAVVHMSANRIGLDRRREYQALFLLDTRARARRHRTASRA